jgi:hypothetical protein
MDATTYEIKDLLSRRRGLIPSFQSITATSLTATLIARVDNNTIFVRSLGLSWTAATDFVLSFYDVGTTKVTKKRIRQLGAGSGNGEIYFDPPWQMDNTTYTAPTSGASSGVTYAISNSFGCDLLPAATAALVDITTFFWQRPA